MTRVYFPLEREQARDERGEKLEDLAGVTCAEVFLATVAHQSKQ